MPDYTIGWVYNLTDPNATSKAGQLITIAVIFPSLATLFLLLRLAIRLRSRQLGCDDGALTSSVLLAIGYSAVTIYQTRWGQALDPQYFPPENLKTFSVVQYSGGPIYCLALLGFKLGLLLFYLRLVGFNKLYSRVIYFFIFLVICNQVIYACLLSFACKPIAKQWDPEITWGSCIDTLSSYYGLGGSSFGFDLIIIALPFPALAKLNLTMKKRLGLAALFAMGFFVSIIQIIRIHSIKNLKNYTDSRTIIIWSIIEINLGSIVACIPTYGVLFNHVNRTYRPTSVPRSNASRPSLTASLKSVLRGRRSKTSSQQFNSTKMMPSHTLPSTGENIWTGQEHKAKQSKTWVTITGPDVSSAQATPYNDRSRAESLDGRTKSGEYFAQHDEFQGITTTREVTVEIESMPSCSTIHENDEDDRSDQTSEADGKSKKEGSGVWCMS